MTLSASGLQDATAQPDDFVHFGSGTVILAPDEKANVGLVTESMCDSYPGGGGPAQTYSTVTVQLPDDDGTLGVTDQQISLNGCPLGVSRFWSDSDERGPEPPDDALARSVDVSIETPTAAVSGDTLVYVVKLTNSTDHKVQLVDNCPSYSERLADYRDADPLVYGGYLLNCADAGSIPAQSSLRFEMRLTVPGAATAGTYDLAWSFQGSDLPGTRTSIDVVEP